MDCAGRDRRRRGVRAAIAKPDRPDAQHRRCDEIGGHRRLRREWQLLSSRHIEVVETEFDRSGAERVGRKNKIQAFGDIEALSHEIGRARRI